MARGASPGAHAAVRAALPPWRLHASRRASAAGPATRGPEHATGRARQPIAALEPAGTCIRSRCGRSRCKPPAGAYHGRCPRSTAPAGGPDDSVLRWQLALLTGQLALRSALGHTPWLRHDRHRRPRSAASVPVQEAIDIDQVDAGMRLEDDGVCRQPRHEVAVIAGRRPRGPAPASRRLA